MDHLQPRRNMTWQLPPLSFHMQRIFPYNIHKAPQSATDNQIKESGHGGAEAEISLK